MRKSERGKRGLKAAIGILLTVVIVTAAFFIYTGVYYRADREEIASFLAERPTVTVSEQSDGNFVFRGDEVKAGLVFYPGAKVEHYAYAPLMAALAEKGYLCVLVKMPLRLAIFKPFAADGARDDHPELKWYIGGHSLGGAIASYYLKSRSDRYEGLLLFGAYSSVDLSGTKLRVLSIYGSEDGVLNRKTYEKKKKYLPKGYQEVVLSGGCHAYFGSYGAQSFDGTPKISRAEQIALTAEAAETLLVD